MELIMIIQKMLKNGEVTLKGLAGLLGMKYLQYPEGYVTITYDQFETPSASRVAAECRGVIFDEEYNIVTRAGGHCAPLMHKALGTQGQGAVRFSFAAANTVADADAAAKAVREIAHAVGQGC